MRLHSELLCDKNRHRLVQVQTEDTCPGRRVVLDLAHSEHENAGLVGPLVGQATDLTEAPAVRRELVLVRVKTSKDDRTAILKEADIFGARVVESSVDGFALEATGDPEKLDAFVEVIEGYGDIEVTRSGLVAVSMEPKKLKLAPPVRKEHLEAQETV